MKRGMLVLLGVLGLAGAAQADFIKASIKFEGPGVASLSKDAQLAVVNSVASHLQGSLAKMFKLSAFESGAIENGLYVSLRGEWGEQGIPQTAAEDMRRAALEAAAAGQPAKLALTDFRIEVDDSAKRSQERDAHDGRHEEMANRERAKPQPRLNIQVKDKLIEEMTILDVPLVRAIDVLGMHMPLAYVIHPEVAGRPVYVRLIGATLDEALGAIADSAHVKVERRDKYVVFTSLPK